MVAGVAGACFAWGVAAPGCGSSGGESTFGLVAADAADDLVSVSPLFGDSSVDDLFTGCATAEAQANRTAVYMLFVLDGSGSMVTSAKWPAAVSALDAIFDDLAVKADPAFGAGLTIFCDAKDHTCMDDPTDPNISYAGPYSVPDVSIGVVDPAQKAALHARLDTTAPYLGTPTYEVLSGAYAALEGFVPAGGLAANGKRVVVLITDGVPDPDMPAGRAMPNGEVTGSLSLSAAEASKKPAVTTFAVGVGQLDPIDVNVYDPKFMGAIAVAGGSPNSPCDPNETVNPANMCHFQITPGTKTAAMLAQEFIDAINTIRTKLLTCEYTLEKPDGGADVDPSKVNVVFTNGAGMKSVVPPDPVNGWSYDDPNNPTKVILNGASCTQAKADTAGKISVVLGCKTIPK